MTSNYGKERGKKRANINDKKSQALTICNTNNNLALSSSSEPFYLKLLSAWKKNQLFLCNLFPTLLELRVTSQR